MIAHVTPVRPVHLGKTVKTGLRDPEGFAAREESKEKVLSGLPVKRALKVQLAHLGNREFARLAKPNHLGRSN